MFDDIAVLLVNDFASNEHVINELAFVYCVLGFLDEDARSEGVVIERADVGEFAVMEYQHAKAVFDIRIIMQDFSIVLAVV